MSLLSRFLRRRSKALPPFPFDLARCMGCDELTDDCTCSPFLDEGDPNAEDHDWS